MVFADKMHDIIEVLENDGVIIYPTDTIWGLGCNVFSQKAIEKIYKIKERVPDNPFVLLVSSIDMAKNYIERIHPRIETLLSYHEHPLTVVFPKAKNLPSFATAKNGSVAMRITNEIFSKTVIDLLGFPLVSTSANISGRPFPNCFEEIEPDLLEKVDYICKHGRNNPDLASPSVIITYKEDGELIFLRE